MNDTKQHDDSYERIDRMWEIKAMEAKQKLYSLIKTHLFYTFLKTKKQHKITSKGQKVEEWIVIQLKESDLENSHRTFHMEKIF